MAAAQSARLPKPQLRGLLATSFRRHAVGAAIFTTINVFLWKFLVADPRKKRYADFYKNYDAEAEFEKMRQLGVFTSAPPDN